MPSLLRLTVSVDTDLPLEGTGPLLATVVDKLLGLLQAFVETRGAPAFVETPHEAERMFGTVVNAWERGEKEGWWHRHTVTGRIVATVAKSPENDRYQASSMAGSSSGMGFFYGTAARSEDVAEALRAAVRFCDTGLRGAGYQLLDGPLPGHDPDTVGDTVEGNPEEEEPTPRPTE